MAQVVVVDGIDERLELARRMGADDVVDLRQFEGPAERAAHVRKLTDGGGDVVFELVGRAAAIEEGVLMVANGGRYLELGTFYPGTTAAIDPGVLVMRNIALQAVSFYDAHSLQKALSFLERRAGDLPLAGSVAEFGLDEIDAAFVEAESGRVARVSLVMS